MANGISFSIKVAPSFENLALAFRSTDIKKAANEYIKKFALRTESYAKQVTPVDTGRLRSSINTLLWPSVMEARVGTNVRYAIFVHEGTKFTRGRPFMKHGLEFAQRRFGGEELADMLDKELRVKLSKL